MAEMPQWIQAAIAGDLIGLAIMMLIVVVYWVYTEHFLYD